MTRIRRHPDWLIGAALFLFTFAVYIRTLAPGVAEMFDDSLEFQVLAPRMAIAHPTGYPLFSILLKLLTYLPLGDPAYRVNLGTAFFAALAAAGLYAAARQLPCSRLAAAAASLLFAFGPTFWSQAVLVEVYALQALLTAALLYVALRWGRSTDHGSLVALAFVAGLSLTHHRMSVLLFPALVVYVLAYNRQILLRPRVLAPAAAAFVLPLLLYLYIPIRGLVTSSLDGGYQNTLPGFFGWIFGTAYNVFLLGNPFNEHRAASFYLDLFLNEFTWLGLLLALAGVVALARRGWREWLLLALGLAANLVFGLNYRVADVQVFFIPAFLLTALFVPAGIDGVVQLAADALGSAARLARPVAVRSVLPYAPALFLLLPLWLLSSNYTRVDLSGKWDVADYGRDVLSQPLPANATIIGIRGEMSLLEYFQDTQGLRKDVRTVAADREPDRLAAVDQALKGNGSVFLTRPLRQAEKKYSLTSFGPLILVQPEPNTSAPPVPQHPLGATMRGVTLLGYDLDATRLADADNWHIASGRKLRVTLYWHVDARIPQDLYVSLKLLGPNGERAAQLDRRPVLDAYPTTAWRTGEYIADSYDLPVLMGAAPGDYTLQATLYDPASGDVLGQQDLEKITLPADTFPHSPLLLDVDHPREHDFGGAALVGYALENGESYDPEGAVPITLLWRAGDDRLHRFELELVDRGGRTVAALPVDLQKTGPAAGQYVREELSVPLNGQPHGTLFFRLGSVPRAPWPCDIPLFSSCITLDRVSIGK